MSNQKKRQCYSLETKLEIIKAVNDNIDYDTIVRKHGLKNKSTISDIIKNKEKLLTLSSKLDKKSLKSFKRSRGSNYPELDKGLYLWFQEKRRKGAPINGLILRAKANTYARDHLKITNFNASNGFITRFAKRYNLDFGLKSGESESVSEETVQTWKTSLKEEYKSYEPKDIFNLDETGMFWKLTHCKTYSLPESSKGYKKCKDRVTAVLIVNSDGSERHLVIIGKSETPRCFKGLKNLPVYQYYYNSTAWMKSDVFSKLMLKLDKKYRAQNRKILLLLDNCSSHPYLNLTNIVKVGSWIGVEELKLKLK